LTYIALNNEAFQAALILRNMTEVKNLIQQVLKDKSLNLVIILQIKKLSKIAIKAITNIIIQSSTNKKLLI
jgi:hypothetical protein